MAHGGFPVSAITQDKKRISLTPTCSGLKDLQSYSTSTSTSPIANHPIGSFHSKPTLTSQTKKNEIDDGQEEHHHLGLLEMAQQPRSPLHGRCHRYRHVDCEETQLDGEQQDAAQGLLVLRCVFRKMGV